MKKYKFTAAHADIDMIRGEKPYEPNVVAISEEIIADSEEEAVLFGGDYIVMSSLDNPLFKDKEIKFYYNPDRDEVVIADGCTILESYYNMQAVPITEVGLDIVRELAEKSAEVETEHGARRIAVQGDFNKALELHRNKVLKTLTKLFPYDLREIFGVKTYYTDYYLEGVEKVYGNEIFHTNGDKTEMIFNRKCGRYSKGDFSLEWGTKTEGYKVKFSAFQLQHIPNDKVATKDQLKERVEALEESKKLLKDIEDNVGLIYAHVKLQLENEKKRFESENAELKDLGKGLSEFMSAIN